MTLSKHWRESIARWKASFSTIPNCAARPRSSKTIYLANGTTVTAISGDYAGAAGSNHGFVSYDELWAYVSESSRRLWGKS